MNQGTILADAITMEEQKIEEMYNKTLVDIITMLNSNNIYTNSVQQKMLESHVKAMVSRSITGEPLPEVDASLFEEISHESINMAKEIIEQLGNLPIEEAYLLSVHFEVAKDNNS